MEKRRCDNDTETEKDPTFPQIYRPISEWAKWRNPLTETTEKLRFLPEEQFKFKRGLSIEQLILGTVEYAAYRLNRNQVTRREKRISTESGIPTYNSKTPRQLHREKKNSGWESNTKQQQKEQPKEGRCYPRSYSTFTLQTYQTRRTPVCPCILTTRLLQQDQRGQTCPQIPGNNTQMWCQVEDSQ